MTPHRKQHSFLHGNRLRQDLVIPEPEDAEALRLQPRAPLLVVRGLGLVMPAIQFQHESLLKANQVDDEPPQRHLSPKFARCQSAASQEPPQFFSASVAPCLRCRAFAVDSTLFRPAI